MMPDQRANDTSKELTSAGKGELGRNADLVSATDLLVNLGQCQRAIRSLLHSAVAGLIPISKQTLPSMTFTLTGLIHATEMAANKVLDEAEGLGSDRDRLGKALARLEPYLNGGDPTVRKAWGEVTECSQQIGKRVMSIMSAMAFQDLTSQHLASAIKSVEEVRERLTEVLAMLDLPTEEQELTPGRARLGAPVPPTDGSRQALADQLWAEMRER
jgi:chemotaxis regulatin CheY-phosphate phosphatase CheZ